MITAQEIQDRRKEIAELRHAESVFRDISARLNERENYEKRWFWELLQNAKDSTNEILKSVKVKIEISDNEVSFSHSGLPFELDDILSLIIQGSSKADKKGKTGRFGTGFMTTYLLSTKVTISGKLNDNEGCFQFLLNRKANSNDEFFKLQGISNEAFEKSIRAESYLGESEFQTKFSYDLDQHGYETAIAGLQCLDELIPVTQLFNEQIASVVVIDSNQTKTFAKEKVQSYTVGDAIITQWEIATLKDDKVQSKYYAYTLKIENYESCVITVVKDNQERIVPFNSNYPRLYFTFPLIGTEEIGIPIIINSESFKPRIERDGIYLKSTEKDDNGDVNQKILQRALLQSIKTFGEFFSNKRTAGVFELFHLSNGKDLTWVDKDWFGKIKKQIVENLSSLKILRCHNQDGAFSLSQMKVPLSLHSKERAQELWRLLSECKEFYIPLYEEIENWKSIVQDYAAVEGKDNPFSYPFVWGVDRLTNFISENATAQELEAKLTKPLAKWINSFYQLLLEAKGTFPLDKKIAINGEGYFRNGEGMFWDNCKDTELSAISDILGLYFKRKLIAEFVIHFHITGVSSFTKELALNEIKSKLNELSGEQLLMTESLESNARFLKWLIRDSNIEAVKDLKIMIGGNNEEKFSWERFRQGDHLYLAPEILFNQAYPLYGELIRSKDCLNDVYARYLEGNEFKWLEDRGLIYQSPLVVKRENAAGKIIEDLIVDEKDLLKLKDKDGQYIHKPELTYSDFAYFTANDGHIFDRNKTATSSLERLRFLLEEAVEKDSCFDDEIQEVLIDGLETPIRFHKCVWVARAKRLNWVNYKSETNGAEIKYLKETPSSKNLSELLKLDESLIKKIRGSKQQILLQKLGVGVSDLLRNSMSSEDLKVSWDKAITNMITSDADPELVEEIFNNANIQAEYEKKLKQKGLIKRNQDIGYLVEQLFKEYILELKNKGYNISIERKPFGSDYILTEESSDLVNNNNQLERFEVNGWLIELKATGKAYAAMTELQAKTASENGSKYALVVVELTGVDVDLEYVRTRARVINTIGEKIQQVIPDFEDVKIKKNRLNAGKEGISVEIEDSNIRFRIQSQIWQESHLTIAEFVRSKFTLKVPDVQPS